MANETMFVAAAIWLTGLLGFFTLLYYTSRSDIARKLWLTGAFGTLFVSMNLLRRGFANYVVDNQLANLSTTMMQVMEVALVLGTLALCIAVMVDAFKKLMAYVTGRSYGQEKEAY